MGSGISAQQQKEAKKEMEFRAGIEQLNKGKKRRWEHAMEHIKMHADRCNERDANDTLLDVLDKLPLRETQVRILKELNEQGSSELVPGVTFTKKTNTQINSIRGLDTVTIDVDKDIHNDWKVRYHALKFYSPGWAMYPIVSANANLDIRRSNTAAVMSHSGHVFLSSWGFITFYYMEGSNVVAARIENYCQYGFDPDGLELTISNLFAPNVGIAVFGHDSYLHRQTKYSDPYYQTATGRMMKLNYGDTKLPV